jgi:hypothetical protein
MSLSMELKALFYFLAAFGHLIIVLSRQARWRVWIPYWYTISTLTDSSNSKLQMRPLVGLCSVRLQQGHQIMNHTKCEYPRSEIVYNIRTLLTTIDAASSMGGLHTGAPPSQSLADDFRNVHILTVPAFQWLQAPNQSPIRRQAHTCKIIGKRQMLSIGGNQESVKDDPWTNGLGIFDMTKLDWTNAYDAAAPAYERPILVSQFYANNSRYPIEWGDPELESIFTSPNGTATTNVSGGSGGSHGSSSSSNSSNSGGRIVNYVVGGVIGGIAALAIIASLIFWRRCRYKRKEKRSRNLAELELSHGSVGGSGELLRGSGNPGYTT